MDGLVCLPVLLFWFHALLVVTDAVEAEEVVAPT